MPYSRILKCYHSVIFSATTSEQSFDESELPIFLSEDEHINSEDISYIRSNSEVINHISVDNKTNLKIYANAESTAMFSYLWRQRP